MCVCCVACTLYLLLATMPQKMWMFGHNHNWFVNFKNCDEALGIINVKKFKINASHTQKHKIKKITQTKQSIVIDLINLQSFII